MTRLSYVAGKWVATGGDSVEALVPAALEHARRLGCGAMARLTFHDRARIVLRLADYLGADPEGLYSLSAKVGATRRDAMRDVAGALGVMRGLARATLKDLPDSTVAPDGPVERSAIPGYSLNLGNQNSPGSAGVRGTSNAGGAATGQHLYVSPNGVGILVNALNFLLWGSAARLTPAFLAGIPVIIKPARQTGSVAAELIRMIALSGLMPPGSLQLLNGQTETFWDYLKFGDQVCFTGSSQTGLKLAKQPKVVGGKVRLILATESVNAAVLGPDQTPGSPGFSALVRCVAREMTTNAGQTCTAIRRVLVPQQQLKRFTDALCRHLDRTVVMGDPTDPATSVGPLIDHEQLRRLNRQVRELVAFGGRVVRGGGRARNAPGPYYEPTVLVFSQPSPVLCDVEPFGPVVSVAGYGSTAEAIRLSNDGGRSLVITLASGDWQFLADMVRGVAPYHGRVHLLDSSSPEARNGRASPVGPVSHGGGEELDGVRSIRQWMHRVVIEGSPSAVLRLTGQTAERAASRDALTSPSRI
ncbi:MAG: aldehyde dehydrogenase family protein [Bifidobacteriaceae bacterium]|jgi:oxepin-CoA hydrolase/3-oxo-5,6-dehydrosuberyl-CoA semialdehyde dehydrogenase|nr:aldehyde dehydrogenase family protein [Bifidobacteriaceae bacterium]